MIETLFGYNAVDKNKNERKESSSQDPLPQYIQLIDSKKSQNVSILLRALNVTAEEVCDALNEGNLFLLFIIFYTHTHTRGCVVKCQTRLFLTCRKVTDLDQRSICSIFFFF
jgi:hypothetical protein